MTDWKKIIYVLTLLSIGFGCVTILNAQETWKLDAVKLQESKKLFDDPRPYVIEYPPSAVIPPKSYSALTYDVPTMKKKMEELVGFRPQDKVGKIAPEIKPGKYSYKDKDKYPGIEKLMIPLEYRRWNPGAPPLGFNFPEFEIVPTKQVAVSLPLIEAGLRNEGKTKLDDSGYILVETQGPGIPFPKPSGKFKAQQIIYNLQNSNAVGDSYHGYARGRTWNRKFKNISKFVQEISQLKLADRVTSPIGYFDERAEKRQEQFVSKVKFLAPRDSYGDVYFEVFREAAEDLTYSYIWLQSMRKFRKLSGGDTQDTQAGSTVIFEDGRDFQQKLSPTRFPYEFKLVDEREFLVPSYSTDGAEYMKREGLEWHNVRLERRPCYVIEAKQLDSSFVYGKRLIYVDQETFQCVAIFNFDQKGRLWRGYSPVYIYLEELGLIGPYYTANWDFIDEQSEFGMTYGIPVSWLGRREMSIGGIKKAAK